MSSRPLARPGEIRFSSGPCVKPPGWRLDGLREAWLGRSHRARDPAGEIAAMLERSHALLEAPAEWRCALISGSATGAMEAALWSLLGSRPVEVFAWEAFSRDWVKDIGALPVESRARVAEYGALPDFTQADFAADVVFPWNGTSSGVRVPDGDWIADNREGLTICDAASAAFAQDLPWHKLDAVAFSWQKALGGEAAHGMLMLGPRALERLDSVKASWPVPKLLNLRAADGKANRALFAGGVINTPSMLCVHDWMVSLAWGESIGGLSALIGRANTNAATFARWADGSEWNRWLCAEARARSTTSSCLRFAPDALAGQSDDGAALAKRMVALLEKEGAALDVGGYRSAPPGLRVWTGPTIERADLEALGPWLDWAFAQARDEVAA